MAADGSELTFVRCPSCRSLVPAVSTKCRMCGATMDPAQGDTDQAKNTSRVRQRTTSIRPSDFVGGGVASESPQDEWKSVQSSAKSSTDPGNDGGFDDPLGEYLEETDEVGSSQELIGGSQNGTEGIGGVDDEDDEDEFGFDDDLAPEESHARGSLNGPGDTVPRPSNTTIRMSEVTRSFVTENPMKSARQEAVRGSNVQQAVAPLGRLVGWFVSYSVPEGKGFEMREGKFFVTAGALKPNDFVVQEPSVSTPHAIVQVSKDVGIRVQDLMSDTGVFVKRKGATEFQREEGAITCATGDIVRFGDIEFVVTIVGDLGK